MERGRFATVLIMFLRFVGSSDVREALADTALAQFIVELIRERFEEIGDGTLIRDLLRFLWEHKEEILDFVLTIIGLFTSPMVMTGSETADPIPLDQLEKACESLGPFTL